MNKNRITITAALPYTNGPIHIGHLAGVYIPADIYARYQRIAGKEVLFVCGSDEHGVPITIRAQKEGVTPQQIVDKYHEIIKKSLYDFGISLDIYSRTSAPIHHKTSSDFFLKLYEDGKFEKKETEQLYDAKNNQFLADRYVTGTCPHCKNEGAYGDQCEKCGTSLNATDLINPKSALSGETPTLKKTTHWFLPLQDHQEWLSEWILKQHKDWKVNVIGQCKSWIDQGLQPRAVTRDLNWGVKVPIADADGKVLYVWFDAPIGYISATKEWAEQNNSDWEPFWKDENTKLVQFIGKDNIVFHCIVFPSMLKAHGGFILPENVPANEFLNLEGDKISTSRNWAVWLNEYLEEFVGKEDVLRYVLTTNMPETKDNDFTWKDFQSKNNNELVATFANFINRVVVLTHKYFEGTIPATNNSEAGNAIINQARELMLQVGASIENYKFREALNGFMEMARIGNKYLADNEPWKKWPAEAENVAEVMHISLQLCAMLTLVADIFLPKTADKMYHLFQFERNNANWIGAQENCLLKTGNSIEKPIHLFDKIDDAIIETQIEKLKKTAPKPVETPKKEEVNAIKNVNFEQFSAMDLRVVTITNAQKVEGADKLLEIKIDIGNAERTVLSGIAMHYKPEDIIGKQVLALLNLEPRKIRGKLSEGMLLLAENNSKLVFVSPEEKVEAGSKVA